jgi:hypothetical protein
MRLFKFHVLMALTIGLVSATVEAVPVSIPTVRVTSTTKVYTLFTFDAVKLSKQGLSIQQAIIDLTQQLVSIDPAIPSITPCPIVADLNATGISCGGSAIQFGTNEFFTFNSPTNLPKITVKLLNGVRNQYGANARSPNGLIPGDPTGRVVRIHFNQRVAQFGLMIDPGVASTVSGVQFLVNHQSTPVQQFTAGVPQFVGVEDSAGFTDVTIIPSGSPRTWVADQFSYLPLANF